MIEELTQNTKEINDKPKLKPRATSPLCMLTNCAACWCKLPEDTEKDTIGKREKAQSV